MGLVVVAATAIMDWKIPRGTALVLIDRWVLDAIGFKLPGKAPIQSGVGLGVWRISSFGKSI